MAFYFPEGSVLQFSTTLASAVNVSAATNANPCVVTTSTSHGYSTNDEVLFETNWGLINESIYKFTNSTATSGSLQELDTTNTQFFPSGSGGGTLKKITNWVTVPQLMDITTTGGEPRRTQIELLAVPTTIEVTTGSGPMSINFTVADDPTNATLKEMLRLSNTFAKCAIRILVSGSAPMYGYGSMYLSSLPQMARNQVNRLSGSVSFTSRATRYGS